ncbi:hypothetical protein J1614_006907 [Plenodomus biglobosus]|nr:hypothetical protein J1614_006907 [Plenodomus biglobosus]
MSPYRPIQIADMVQPYKRPCRSDADELKAALATIECAICLDMFGHEHRPLMVQACGHLFGAQCLVQWVESGNATSNKCPVCRGSLSESSGIIDEDGGLFYLGIENTNFQSGIGPAIEASVDDLPPPSPFAPVPAEVVSGRPQERPAPADNGQAPSLAQRLGSAMPNPIISVMQKSRDVRTAFHNRYDHSDFLIGLVLPGRRENSTTAARARDHNASRLHRGGWGMNRVPWGLYLHARPEIARAPAHSNRR